MGFGEAVRHGFRRYAGFRGRATRAEFGWFVTFAVLVEVALTVVAKYLVAFAILSGLPGLAGLVAGAAALLVSLFTRALILPLSAVAVRRFHDVGLSGG